MFSLVGEKYTTKMAKRGRKPKEKKGYFYEDEEKAIVKYIETTNEVEKNKIFDTILYPALTKMIESIIRRYKLFVPDEEFDQNFSDTISYLLTKINHFKPLILKYEPYEGDTSKIECEDISEEDLKVKNKNVTDEDPDFYREVIVETSEDGEEENIKYQYVKKVEHKYKAYSYCGTVCKNYLMYKCAQYSKKRQRNTPYDDVFEEINNDSKYSSVETEQSTIAESLVSGIASDIGAMISEKEKNGLSEDEIKVGNALISLLRNWEEVLPKNGSNKLQKSAILFYLREETMMTTKEVRDSMARFKKNYYILKKKMLEL